MPRCCTCDYDPHCPSVFNSSLERTGGVVRYRKRLKDYYCQSCYISIVSSVNVSRMRDEYNLNTDLSLLTAEDIDSILLNTPTLPVRELV